MPCLLFCELLFLMVQRRRCETRRLSETSFSSRGCVRFLTALQKTLEIRTAIWNSVLKTPRGAIFLIVESITSVWKWNCFQKEILSKANLSMYECCGIEFDKLYWIIPSACSILMLNARVCGYKKHELKQPSSADLKVLIFFQTHNLYYTKQYLRQLALVSLTLVLIPRAKNDEVMTTISWSITAFMKFKLALTMQSCLVEPHVMYSYLRRMKFIRVTIKPSWFF